MASPSTHRESHLREGLFELKKNPSVLCLVKGCRKTGHHGKMSLCHRHWQQRWRLKNRKPSAYAALRDHCIARGVPFQISFDYFCGITDAMGYWTAAETPGLSPSLDRVNPSLGYISGNLRVITRSENSAKSNRERFLPAHVQDMLRRKREQLQAKLGEIERAMMSAAERNGDPF